MLMSLFGWSWWIGFVVFGFSLSIFPFWEITLVTVVRYLDQHVLALEESCGLLLRPVEELRLLERLQAERTENALSALRLPDPVWLKLVLTAGIFIGAITFSFLPWRHAAVSSETPVVRPAAVTIPLMPGISTVSIRINPPAYTGRAIREQSEFSLRVEEGAIVNWEITTQGQVDSLVFFFNDTLVRRPIRAGKEVWRLTMPVRWAGFYQVKLDNKMSDLYKLELLKDQPPKITILTPHAYTVIDYGESTRVSLGVRIQDDYGIDSAAVAATVSSGKGEAVKFKQQEFRWDVRGGRSYTLSKTLDLTALGMKPGDELYFYCKARDNHGQEARTDMYIVALADTAQLMSLDGMTMSTDVKPEYFRSERQIIIDAEQLLRRKDTITVKDFNERSNDLGLDQKLLRLRYGKFLGEEAEEGEPGGEGGASEGEDGRAHGGSAGDVGDAKKILDAFTDKHDNAEDATYFEPAIKQQLKATLTEMWNAELRLRTGKPQEALPFAYKALRLLKDLQQQSRAFVAKTGVKVTPLNPARRLTGELKGIDAPMQRVEKAGGLSEDEVLRMALAILDRAARPGEAAAGAGAPGGGAGGTITASGKAAEPAVETNRATGGNGMAGAPVNRSAGQLILGGTTDAERVLLKQTMRRLGQEAAQHPAQYLDAYQDMRQLAEGKKVDAARIERAIRNLLPAAEPLPVLNKKAADDGLSKLYFKHVHS